MRIALKNIRKRGELTVSKFRTRTSLCSCLSLNSLLRDVKQKKQKKNNNYTTKQFKWLLSGWLVGFGCLLPSTLFELKIYFTACINIY